MRQICVVVLIGLPGAGKTSFCNQINKKLITDDAYKTYTVTYDDIIKENYQNQYKELRNTAFASVESIINSIISSKDAVKKHLIFIDDNMYYKSMRYEYYKLAKKYKISFLQLYMDVDVSTAKFRNKMREQRLQIPEMVVQDMSNKIEVPGNEHWELNSLTLNSNSHFDERIFNIFSDMLDKCINQPIRPTHFEEKTGPLPITKLQSIDLILRTVIHKKITADVTQTSTYIAKKKKIYQKIKKRQILISDNWNEQELSNYLESLF